MKYGFTLVETLVSVAIFSIIATSAWVGLANLFSLNNDLRAKTTAVNLATEQIEIIRNLPYGDVGVENSIPAGVIPRTQTLNRDTYTFEITTTIRNIDHEFDGTIGGDPNDLSPADSKLAEVTVDCVTCSDEIDNITISTWVSPLALETSGNNGAIFVNVFDANGHALAGADIHIENNQTSTPVVIDDVTDNDGILRIIDATPGVGVYEISATKSGFSTERTYEIGTSSNPVPDKPHANVSSGEVTDISFSIDALSELDINTKDITCNNISNVDFHLTGSKTIGLNVFKYDEDHNTNSQGNRYLPTMEWDTYDLTITESGKDLIGANPSIPFVVNPGSIHEIDIILGNSDPNAVLISVIDGSNEQLLSDALISFQQGATTVTASTGSGYVEQQDWSGGSGQSDFSDETRYYSDDGDIDVSTQPGEIRLASIASTYEQNGWLESSTVDVGTTSNFLIFNWLPVDQPAETGSESVRFQIATNETLDSPVSWDFVGPDGTGSSYFTVPGQPIHSFHNDDRYLRYKAYLKTDDTNYTPNITNAWFSFASNCTPVGQAYISDLNGNQYDITVEKEGYETQIIEDQTFTEDWQTLIVTLTPDE